MNLSPLQGAAGEIEVRYSSKMDSGYVVHHELQLTETKVGSKVIWDGFLVPESRLLILRAALSVLTHPEQPKPETCRQGYYELIVTRDKVASHERGCLEAKRHDTLRDAIDSIRTAMGWSQ